ncbi:MAG: Fic family protein [Myxococcales bacterium]|nr:Fic family protein [Myxococcales bacterium]
MIFQVPRLDARELEISDRIEELKQRLGYATRAPARRWQGLLRRNSFANAIRGSNSIEGYNVSVDDAVAAAEGAEPRDASADTWAAITGYRAAMTYVLELADDPHFSFSTDLLRSLHFMMIQADLTRHPGRWRPGPIFVHDDQTDRTLYEGPPAEDVPAMAAELALALNRKSEEPVTVRAAMAHLNLVMIHPFSDGNGRMARCLQTLVLARAGTLAPMFCSIEEYLGKNTQSYYDVLGEVGGGAWHPERDARPWVRFCLAAHFRQASTLLRRSREMSRLWEVADRELRKRGLPERMVVAFVDAAMGFQVRNATYRCAAEVSDQVAGRDLRQLAVEGFLEAVGERRGRYYKASRRLAQLFAGLREPKQTEDPFADRL